MGDLPALYPSMMQDDITIENATSRSIIIKMPVVRERSVIKGILIVTFTDTSNYFFFNIDVERLLKYFYIVLEPSSAGYCLPQIMFWTMYKEPIFVQATEVTDRIFMSSLNSNLVPLEFGASDWVNYNKFHSLKLDKLYDSIYVANYANVKRLHVYFKALQKIKKKKIEYKGAIVCAKWGGKRETILKLIEYYGVSDILDRYESLKAPQINKVLNKSKCNLLLSLKEGSSRSLFESIFSNTPVIVLKNNVGVNKAYINCSTGMLVDELELADTLITMKSRYERFCPRKWAMNNISPEVTTDKLIDKIKTIDDSFVAEQGDVLIKTNEPEVTYMNNQGDIDSRFFVKEVFKLFQKGEMSLNVEKHLSALASLFYGK
jgi:glycosyltransferase involved in cell wall biosynthesis